MIWQGSRHTAEVNGVQLHWGEVGSGKPLVLLHGLGDSHLSWCSVAPLLASTHRVIALDLPGHGLSGRPDASYALDWHADIVGAWFDHLDLDTFDLVGHSFGGGVAQFALLSHAAQIDRLGLVAAGGLGHEVSLPLRLLTLPGAEQLIQPVLGVGTSLGLSRLAGPGFTDEHRRWSAWTNSSPGTARAMSRTARGVIDLAGQHRHFLDRAHDIDQLPAVSIYWGERDPVLPIKQAYRAMDYITGAALTTFADTGHFPHLEVPDQFAGQLQRFLDDSAAKRARVVVGAVPPSRSAVFWANVKAIARGVGSWWRHSRVKVRTRV